MKLNRLVLSALISSALLSAGAMAADTGTITFTGSITGTTCDVSVGNGGADATVLMGDGSEAALVNAGDVDGDTRFSMRLANCSGVTAAKAFFHQGDTVTAQGRLSNTADPADAARNVTLQLRDSQGVINLGDTSQLDGAAGYVAITGGAAELPYVVQYHSEGGTTAGAVTSQVVYSIAYP
ncbi:TPA: type 1 fimbrial protein [Klebsiella oxytoca]|nr:type 1 fimbrial protein [Klebsiella michiganensis]HEC2122604.1 type 1 fimbrial protein [Klebsiella oxytoca]